jgi:hypothetical protein
MRAEGERGYRSWFAKLPFRSESGHAVSALFDNACTLIEIIPMQTSILDMRLLPPVFVNPIVESGRRSSEQQIVRVRRVASAL